MPDTSRETSTYHDAVPARTPDEATPDDLDQERATDEGMPENPRPGIIVLALGSGEDLARGEGEIDVAW